MKKRWPILLGVLVFLYALVMYAPLAVVYSYLKPASSPVELLGVAGTPKQGSAAGVVVRGETAVRDLRWTMSAWQLLIAEDPLRLLSQQIVARDVHQKRLGPLRLGEPPG